MLDKLNRQLRRYKRKMDELEKIIMSLPNDDSLQVEEYNKIHNKYRDLKNYLKKMSMKDNDNSKN